MAYNLCCISGPICCGIGPIVYYSCYVHSMQPVGCSPCVHSIQPGVFTISLLYLECLQIVLLFDQFVSEGCSCD